MSCIVLLVYTSHYRIETSAIRGTPAEVYLYLVNYAESNSDLAILAINTLQKDGKIRVF